MTQNLHARNSSPSAALKARLDYPVIDTDLHTIEFAPELEDYIAKHGGGIAVDQFRAAINRGFGYLSNEWYELTPEERAATRSVGSEADDPTVAYAFNTRVNPLGAQLNAFWASDSGHWDVPDLTKVLAETYSLVERGALTEQNFRDLVFTHPSNFFAGKNPEFFKGTAVEAKLTKSKAA